jgi:CheY-like chemotaxis protein
MTRRLDVVVVDLDEMACARLVEWIGPEHNIRVATDVRDGIGLILDRVPDVVVCDVELPPFRGDALLSMIAQEYPQIRRVLYACADARLGPLARTADAVIHKPSNRDELRRALNL